MQRPEKPQRPGAESEALEVSLAGEIPIVDRPSDTRCSCCGRVLRAPRSIARELGPVCAVRLEVAA